MKSRKVKHHVLYFLMIFLLQNTNLKVENILNWQGNTQRTRTATKATNAVRPSNQTSSRTRSTPIVATNVNQGERAPTTQTRNMAAQALGSQASSTTTCAQSTWKWMKNPTFLLLY